MGGTRAAALATSSALKFLSYMRSLPAYSLDDANDRLDRLSNKTPYDQAVVD